jgi:hypothetical protein
MTKLTLSVNEGVVSEAKRYAKARGTSVSRLVETMLELMSSHGHDAPAATPVLRRLRGSLKRGSVSDYRRHLERKYR